MGPVGSLGVTNPLSKGIFSSKRVWLHWVHSSAAVVADTVKTYVSKPPFYPAIGLLGAQRPLEEISGRNLEKNLSVA